MNRHTDGRTDKLFGAHHIRCPKDHTNDEKALNFFLIGGRSKK